MARPLRSRLLRLGIVLASIFVLYTALGFLVAPLVLRRVLVRRASEALHRPVTVERVRVNPLVLSVTLAGLAVREQDGSPFVGWESLYVRLAPLRLFSGDVGLAEIRLVRPEVHAGLLADGSLSFQDLLASPAEPAPAAASEKAGGGLGVSIGRLAIEEARVSFRDATRRPAFESVVGPFTIRLESFRTKGGGESPYSFTGTTESGETFRWTGRVGTQPVRSDGTVAFERISIPRYRPYTRDATPSEIRSGVLDLTTRYELEWGPARHVLRLLDGKVVVSDLAVAPVGSPDEPVRLSRLEVSGVEVDAVAHRARVEEVALTGLALRIRREADGSLELPRLARAVDAPATAQPGAADAPPPPPPRPAAAPEPWGWSVGALAVSGGITLEDRVPSTPVQLALSELRIRLEQLRPGADAVSPFSLSFGWPGGGKVAVKGPVRPFGSQATLDLEANDLDLVPLAPYLAPATAVRLASGRAGARAQVSVDASGGAARWAVAGDVRLDGLALAEKGNPDLFRWRALEVNGVDAGSTPPHATVRQIRIVEPRTKVYVWEDGTSSMARARPAPAARPAQAASPPRAAAPAAAAGPAWKTAVGSFEIVGARASFVDRTVTPPAVLNLTRGTVKVTRLSSDPRVRSDVDVKLEVEGASPIRVTGTLNPLQSTAFTDLGVTSAGVDLTPLGPYTGKYLGYGLQKGKLNLDLHYRVENRMLTSTNVITLDQFTLGEGTNSPDAMKVPIKLALALLRDGDGMIVLDVPVEGRLDDPEFRLGKVIWRAVVNLLVKVATSPFRLLASLAGGDHQELSVVEFTPGTSEVPPASQERLAALARSLAKRPALGLDVEGSADEAQDGAALRRAALERALRHAEAATLKSPPASEEEIVLAPEERLRLVRAAYLAAFPPAAAKEEGKEEKPAGKAGEKAEPAAEPTPEEMEERLAAAQAIPPDAFESLAQERAERARDALVAAGIDQARLFLTRGGDRASKEKGARAYFEVK